MALARVRSVGRQVYEIVQQIHTGRAKAKRDKRQKCLCKEPRFSQSMRSRNWNKHEQVLEPLVRTHSAQVSSTPR